MGCGGTIAEGGRGGGLLAFWGWIVIIFTSITNKYICILLWLLTLTNPFLWLHLATFANHSCGDVNFKLHRNTHDLLSCLELDWSWWGWKSQGESTAEEWKTEWWKGNATNKQNIRIIEGVSLGRKCDLGYLTVNQKELRACWGMSLEC